jgi:hypothetical protein
MYDSYGDGWNGSTYDISSGGVSIATGGLLSGAYGSDTLCLPTGCYDITVGGGSWTSEVSFDFGSLVGAGVGTYTDISIGGATCGIGGCTDPAASNYDANASYDDGSCTYSCAYYGLDEVTVNLYDSWGDGWNGNTLTVDGTDYTMATGSSESFAVCVDLSACISVLYNNTGSYASENSWDITDASGTVLLSGGNVGSGGDFGNGCAVYGCTDSTAINYDPLATADDGSCIAPIYGCTDPLALNYFPGANINDPNNPCCYVAGCTDPNATNYDPNACYDDGSCVTSSSCSASPVDSVWMSDIIHDRSTFNWNSMNSATCDVDQMVIRYREVGSSSWTQKFLGNPTGSTIYYGTSKRVLGLSASTTYEYQFKIWYMGVSSPVNWGANPSGTFTTLGDCPNVGNFAVSTPLTTRATFTWDDANGVYSFARIKMRVDSISNPTGADWQNVGGFGVVYPTFTRNKNGLTPGETYRGQSRTWCDPAGGPYKSSNWTSLIFWTQPTVIRLEGGSAIANLDVYPNPSRDIFNVTFTSEDAQDLDVRVINVVGEVVYTENLDQFIGEYTKAIDLATYTKGVYFLEITTNNGVVNKKLILQ